MNPHLLNIILGRKSGLAAKVAAILRKYGTDAHVYLPGVGVINGLTAGNYLDSAGTTAATVDNPVGKVTDANGTIAATQATTANKPILRKGAVNLILHSQDFSNGYWSKLNSGTGVAPAVTADYSTAPDGTATADRVIFDLGATPATAVSRLYVNAASPSDVNNNSIYAKTNDGSTVTMYMTGGLGDNNPVTITPTWTRINAPVTTSAAYAQIQLGLAGGYSTSNYADLSLWGAQVTQGSDLADYAPTTTAPASNLVGNYHHSYDGTNDSLVLGSVPFQMADDHCVIAGVRNDSGAATSKVVFGEYGAGTQAVAKLSFETATLTATWTDDAGTAGTSPTGSAVTAGTTVVATARKVGNAKELRKNGVSINTSSTAAGATTLTGASIGALSASAYMVGSIYPVIAIKGTVTDADCLILERFAGTLCGVTI